MVVTDGLRQSARSGIPCLSVIVLDGVDVIIPSATIRLIHCNPSPRLPTTGREKGPSLPSLPTGSYRRQHCLLSCHKSTTAGSVNEQEIVVLRRQAGCVPVSLHGWMHAKEEDLWLSSIHGVNIEDFATITKTNTMLQAPEGILGLHASPAPLDR